jgi:hypothetical protein
VFTVLDTKYNSDERGILMQYGRWLIPTIVALGLEGGPLWGQQPLDTLALKAHTYFLAHDLLEGRATGTAGAETAALYIAGQCRALGLSPAGPDYLQEVPLEESKVESGTQFTVTRGGRTAVFRYPGDFTPDVGTRSTLVNVAGHAHYVGPANVIERETLQNLDLDGSVAVVAGARVSSEGAEILRERGAAAILHLLADAVGYDLYRRSRGESRLYHADSTVQSSFLPPIPSILAGPRLSYAMIAGTAVERGEELSPGPLGREVALEIVLTRRQIEAQNVVCLLPGSEAPASDTAIVFTAHYDHLGVGVPDSSGDAVYNGFSDNAAGVAMLLSIAQAMKNDAERPMRHSAIFLFLVGEERGLLGSDFYVARPFWPLDRTLAVINIDAGAPPGQLMNWRLAGVDSTGLGALAIEVAEGRGWTVTTSPARANSDYYPFVREGVPGVFVIPGPGPYEGLSADSSDALRTRWGYYHQPADHWTEDFPFSGLARYAEYGYLIALALDSAPALLPDASQN